MAKDSGELRKNRRVYDIKPTLVRLKGYALQVDNISNDGIGLVLGPEGPHVVTGEHLDAILLPLSSGEVSVAGTVSHISITETGRRLGIRFSFNDDEFQWVMQFRKERMRATG